MNAVPKNGAAPAGAPAKEFELKPAGGKPFSTFGVSPLQHNFHEHPLMQLPRLAELAKSLAKTNQCRFIIPGSEQGSKFDHTSQSPDGRTVDEVFRRMEESGSWVAL